MSAANDNVRRTLIRLCRAENIFCFDEAQTAVGTAISVLRDLARFSSRVGEFDRSCRSMTLERDGPGGVAARRYSVRGVNHARCPVERARRPSLNLKFFGWIGTLIRVGIPNILPMSVRPIISHVLYTLRQTAFGI
jgi:hypothetical protein